MHTNKRDFRKSPGEPPSYPAFDARRRRLLVLLGVGAISVMARGGCMPMYPAPADIDNPRDAGRPDSTPDRGPPSDVLRDQSLNDLRDDLGDT